MPRSNEPGVDWLLVEALMGDVPTPFHPVLDDYLDLHAREQAAGVADGTPILVSPDFSWDRGLALYFNTAVRFTGMKANTKLSEAREIKGWLTYLEAQEVHWLDAGEQHYERYRRLRTDPDTVQQMIDRGDLWHEPGKPLPVVTVATFEKTHAALHRLYTWAVNKGLYEGHSPIPAENRDRRHAAKRDESKQQWLLPGAYRLWRSVGLGGRTLERDSEGRLRPGLEDPSWKGGALAARNQAFVDLMATTGLRMHAAATLLTVELPTPGADTRVARAVDKFERGYAYTPTPSTLQQIAAYQRFGRRAAVRRAQREHRYDADDAVVIERVGRVRREGMVLYREDGSPYLKVDEVDAAMRRRLFTRNEDGLLEPMSLWLTERGTPAKDSTFQDVFDAANDRVLAAFEALAAHEEPPDVNAHMLRYSFALWVLVALHKRIDAEQGYSPYDAYDVSRYGAAYALVQDLLNHKQEETTIDTYLRPAKRLRQAALFDETVGMDLEALIGHFTRHSDLMVRAGDEPTGGV